MPLLAPRFWIPPEGALHLADDGFLPDPEDAYTAAFNPAVVPFSAIAPLRCLVLIGEPGLGKTTALVAERLALEDQLREDAADAHVLAVDLGATREEAVLRGQLFESDRYRAWQSGTGQLHLFLDSLDEARLRIETIADLLLEGLEGAEFERLHLRLACRSADRHRRLEDALRAGIGDDQFAVYELVPLRRRDVSDAAREQGLDANTFLGEVIGRSLQPLAIRPLTLRFLLRAAAEPGGLPAGATELYRRGSQLLVQEPDEDRRRGAAAGRLAAAQRLAVAARIAAATILAGRSAVVTEIDLGPSLDEADVEHLAGGRELTEGTAVADSFAVDVDAVQETLSTGLFSARGTGRLGWAHQSLGEFLAAVYIASRGMREQQVLDLLTLKEGNVRRVIPQLREVAGWLATLSPFLFEVLLPGDPDVLLRSDLAVAGPGQRKALVGALLAGVDAGTIERWDGRIRSNFLRLDHPALGDQLREVLVDPGAPLRGRELAADLAGACRVASLEPTLVGLALGDDAPVSLRQAAVSALSGWAGIETRRELVPLALTPPAGDVDDELRGAALSAVWPDILGANELFDSLTDPRRSSLFGLYKSFLIRELVPGLSDTDLPVALRWATRVPRRHHPTDALSEVVQQILVRAWSSRAVPDVMHGITALAATFLEGGFDLLDQQEREKGRVLATGEERHELVRALLPRVSTGEIDPINLILLSSPSLLGLDDFEWLIANLESASSADDELGWARMIRTLLPSGASLPRVMEARENSAVLRNLTADWFAPVRLDSEDAVTLRENWRKAERWRQEREQEEARAPDMAARIQADLERFEAGELDAFWHLNLDLSVKQGERHYGRHFESALTEFAGWQAADGETRERILAAAERYLRDGDPRPEEWFGSKKIWEPAYAGYRALRLVSELSPERLARMGQDPWERWAPIIFSWPRDGVDEADWNDAAVAECFRRVPEVAARWFAEELDANLHDGRAYEVRRAQHVPVAAIGGLILERAGREDLPPTARAELLEFLMGRGATEVGALAETLLTPARLAEDARSRELGILVAQALVEHAPDAGWGIVWPRVQEDDAFGRAVFEKVADYHETDVATRLDEAQLADLFRWLEMHYPRAEDPAPPDGASRMSPRDQIAWWRDRLIQALAAKGTPEALQQLADLEADLPHLPWIGRLRRQAEELVRRERWTPPAPADVVRMGADAARRWVVSEVELRETVVEALGRVQEALQAATPAAADVWDTVARRPKRENELSDWLKRQVDQDLRGRGVVVGREVQIRPGPGGKMGEAGDLVIEAVAGEFVGGAPLVGVTVEVKGCWHPEVDHALRTQLAERYLVPEGERQGVYIVGWFAADDWDIKDWRRKACAGRGLAQSRSMFAEQAREVSEDLDLEIEAVVLDCSLPPRSGPARRA